MTFPAILLAALAVQPADQMRMADHLLEQGEYARAKTEYLALSTLPGVQVDELLYRLAETERAMEHPAEARHYYTQLLTRYPGFRQADRARLQRALAGTPDERKAELPVLEGEQVEPAIRAAALYHLGVLLTDPVRLDRCRKADPQGPYAKPAAFHYARLLSESSDPARHREAVGVFLEIGLNPAEDPARAREALYLAVRTTYADERFGEVCSLAKRFLGCYPDGAFAGNVRVMAAWSHYLTRQWSVAETLCGDLADDDLAYLRAACALAQGQEAKSRPLLERYLADYPQGRYRAPVELALSRLNFKQAEADGDETLLIESAGRSALLSQNPADRLRYAWALEKAGQHDKALAEYEEITARFPQSPESAEALFRKSMMAARKELWSDCARDLGKALEGELSPTHRAEALYWRGVAAYRLPHQDHVAEGVGFLKQALEAGLSLEQSREARLLIADADYEAGRGAEAKAAYGALVREGACVRMSADRIRKVGRFLLSDQGGPAAPAEAALCGKALVEQAASPEWRQTGHALRGAAEEAQGLSAAALGSYRQAMAESVAVPTEDLPQTALALGILEVKAGEYEAAERTLASAVRLTPNDHARRVKAYLWLAYASRGRGNFKDARRYATFVTMLFDDKEAAAEAQQLLDTLPPTEEAAK